MTYNATRLNCIDEFYFSCGFLFCFCICFSLDLRETKRKKYEEKRRTWPLLDWPIGSANEWLYFIRITHICTLAQTALRDSCQYLSLRIVQFLSQSPHSLTHSLTRHSPFPSCFISFISATSNLVPYGTDRWNFFPRKLEINESVGTENTRGKCTTTSSNENPTKKIYENSFRTNRNSHTIRRIVLSTCFVGNRRTKEKKINSKCLFRWKKTLTAG